MIELLVPVLILLNSSPYVVPILILAAVIALGAYFDDGWDDRKWRELDRLGVTHLIRW